MCVCFLVSMGKLASILQIFLAQRNLSVITISQFALWSQMIIIPFMMKRANLYVLSHYTLAILYFGALFSFYSGAGYLIINCTVFPILPLFATFLFGSFWSPFAWSSLFIATSIGLYVLKGDAHTGGFPDSTQLRDFTFVASILNMSITAILGGIFGVTSYLKQKELEKERDKAQELSKIKSEFTANVSHEIRTPLVAMIGLSELLAKDSTLSSDQRYLINTVYSASLHLENLVTNVLNFSKTESNMIKLENTPFDVAELVEETCLYFSAMAESCGIRLITFIDPLSTECRSHVRGDPHRVQQILQNLLANAIKFCTDSLNGEVLVTLEALPAMLKKSKSKQNLIERGAPTCTYRFSVADNGIGISKEGIEKLFTPFSQCDTSTTRRYGGTGLGLAICKQLCVFLGGDISVESSEGKGTVVTFTIQLEVMVPTLHPSLFCDKSALLPADDTSSNQTNKETMINDEKVSEKEKMKNGGHFTGTLHQRKPTTGDHKSSDGSLNEKSKHQKSGFEHVAKRGSMFSPDIQKALLRSQERMKHSLHNKKKSKVTPPPSPINATDMWSELNKRMKDSVIGVMVESAVLCEVIKTSLTFRGFSNVEEIDSEIYSSFLHDNTYSERLSHYDVIISDISFFIPQGNLPQTPPPSPSSLSDSSTLSPDNSFFYGSPTASPGTPNSTTPTAEENVFSFIDAGCFASQLSRKYVLLVSACKYHRFLGKFTEFIPPAPNELPACTLSTESKSSPPSSSDPVRVVFCTSNPVRRSSLANALLACTAEDRESEHKTENELKTPDTSPIQPNSEPKGGLRILLAEDNQVNVEVITRQLRKLGYLNCDVRNNGADALKAFQESEYDLILMDCQMPVLDGYEATREIRKIEQSRNTAKPVRIVALSASAMPEERERGMKAGMNSYLSKPIQLIVLKSILEVT